MMPVGHEERTKETQTGWSRVHPAVPYVFPFAAFMLLLMAGDTFQLGSWEFPVRVTVLAGILWVFSRNVIDLRVRQWLMTTLVGVAVFAIWVAPDMLIPGYRDHWLFQNSITGAIKSSIPVDLRDDLIVLLFRSIRAVIIVPIIEELFWRGWLMRWLISPDFESVPLGSYTPASMWITALLFASEHGPYWEVGLAAGLIYNWWMVRTKSLGDCILAHGITNAALSLFVILTGRWQYWL